MEIKELVNYICAALSEKKAKDIDVIDVKDMTSLTEAFIICSAKSSTAVKAIADNVEEKMTELGREPMHKDGNKEARWIVLDYDEVIVHVFYE